MREIEKEYFPGNEQENINRKKYQEAVQLFVDGENEKEYFQEGSEEYLQTAYGVNK
jgi:hypothetical protein